MHVWVCLALLWFEMVEEGEGPRKETPELRERGKREEAGKGDWPYAEVLQKSWRQSSLLSPCSWVTSAGFLQTSKVFFFFINFNSLAPGPMLGAEHRGQMKSWVAWGTCSSKGRQTGKWAWVRELWVKVSVTKKRKMKRETATGWSCWTRSYLDWVLRESLSEARRSLV